jgi:hypothetical protein
MKTLLVLLFAFGLTVSIAAAQTAGGSVYSGSSRCNIVQLKPGESPPLPTPTGSLPKAPGRKAAEPAGAIPIPSQADGSRVVTDANGGCTIYRYKTR